MTAYIDNIIIQGTPEEIQEFIELRKPKVTHGNSIEITTDGTTVHGNWEFSNGYFIPDNMYFQNDNVEFDTPSG